VLDLSFAEAHSLFIGFGSKSKGIECSARVQSLVEVSLGVTVDLSTTDEENLQKGKLGDGKRKVKVQVASSIKLNLSSLVPVKLKMKIN